MRPDQHFKTFPNLQHTEVLIKGRAKRVSCRRGTYQHSGHIFIPTVANAAPTVMLSSLSPDVALADVLVACCWDGHRLTAEATAACVALALYQVLFEMEAAGVEPTAYTYTMLLDCVVKRGKAPDGFQVRAAGVVLNNVEIHSCCHQCSNQEQTVVVFCFATLQWVARLNEV